MNGGLVMCGGLGALAATWPVEFALRHMGWLDLALLLAALTLARAVAVRWAVPETRPGPLCAPSGGPAPAGLRDILRDPMIRRFAPLSASCFGAVLAIQGLWVGPWLADVDGLSRSDVASVLAGMALVLVVAAPGWGMLTHWMRPRMPLSTASAGAAVVLLGVEASLLGVPGLPLLLPWCVFAAFGGLTVLGYSVLAEHFPVAAIGRANAALNVGHIGCSFLLQSGIGQILAHWAPVAGHYPASAYRAAMMLPMTLQIMALARFAWPRKANAGGAV